MSTANLVPRVLSLPPTKREGPGNEVGLRLDEELCGS